MIERGNIVVCVEKPGWLDGLTRGKEYVVSDTEGAHGAHYIKFIGDDDKVHTLLATMFRPRS